jgi:signal transduction histidine kinase/CheY-like chemotaxis protein
MFIGFAKKVDRDFLNTAEDFLKATSWKLIAAIAALYFVWAYLVFFFQPIQETIRVAPISLIALCSSVLPLILLKRQYLVAQLIWICGLISGILVALLILRIPEISLCYALIPILAVVTIGWPAGLIAAGLGLGLTTWANLTGLMGIPPAYFWIISLGGLLTGYIGWVSTVAFFNLTQWSIYSYQQARKNMEEARDQRLEIKQIQDDLLHANRELSRLSERLKAMNQVAEEARHIKEEFVANVSHELRTPLNLIIGFCEMITQSPKIYGKKLPALLLADITAIQRNSQHLSELVNDVLDLSQIEAGRMALSKQWTCMQDILLEASDSVRALFNSKSLYLETDMPEAPIRLYADHTRIREVILNILSNAGRFTEKGGVRLKTWADAGRVVVSITDTGPGIPIEDQERIFEPFQQLDTSIQRKYGGSGLGLSISKQFIEMHDGKMWLESQKDVGTTFFFSLPQETLVVFPPGNEVAVSRWVNPYQHYETPLRRSKAPVPTWVPRFVVVEKEDSLSKLCIRYLENAEIVKCQTMDTALQEIKNTPAQALIVNSPYRNEVLDQINNKIRELPFGTPVIVCRVAGSGDVARQIGAVQYLVKPVTHEKILESLAEVEEYRAVKTILLVEDNPDVLQLFMRILSSGETTYQIIRAMTGQQALHVLHERKPDVMLLDLILPGMNGYQVIQEKNQDSSIRDIPVIVISSLDPTGAPILSDFLGVTKSGGLSVKDFMSCISAISEILSPHSQPTDLMHRADSSA